VATILEMKEKNVAAYLAEKGKKLKDGYNTLAAESGIAHYTRCSGYDCRSLVSFDATAGNPLELKSFVQQEMFKRGVLWSGFHNMSFSHTDIDVDYTLAAYREVLGLLKEAVSRQEVASLLRGAPIEPVFRKVSNFNTKPVSK